MYSTLQKVNTHLSGSEALRYFPGQGLARLTMWGVRHGRRACLRGEGGGAVRAPDLRDEALLPRRTCLVAQLLRKAFFLPSAVAVLEWAWS